jgi:hypothetical protein
MTNQAISLILFIGIVVKAVLEEFKKSARQSLVMRLRKEASLLDASQTM